MAFGDVVELDGVECIAETSLAILCIIDGEEYWIPLSQVDDASDVRMKGDEGCLVITQWIAEQRGIG